MRYCRIVVLLFLAACKVTSPTTRSAYSEDLSVHRPAINVDTVEAKTLPIKTEAFVPLRGHIKAEMDSILRISIAQNREGKLVDGFVLLVYTGNNRNEANEIWYRIDSNFPELDPKISYRQPNFQVRAGKFTDRLKAHQTLKAVKKEFPKALLVPERFKLVYE